MSLPFPYESFLQNETERVLHLELGRARTVGSTLVLLLLKPDGTLATIVEANLVKIDEPRGLYTYSTQDGDLSQIGVHVAYLRETLSGPTRTHFSPRPLVGVVRQPSQQIA